MAYLILAAAYFLIGSIRSFVACAPVRNAVRSFSLRLHFAASRAGDLARQTLRRRHHAARRPRKTSARLAIPFTYTMVNIGGAAGPYLAGWAHDRFGVENVFRLSALSVFAMFLLGSDFFREPRKPGGRAAARHLAGDSQLRRGSLAPEISAFLLIFTGY